MKSFHVPSTADYDAFCTAIARLDTFHMLSPIAKNKGAFKQT